MQTPTFEYVAGTNLDDLGLFVRTNGALIDLSSGYSYSLVVGDGSSGAGGFTTTTGFTGAAGSGVPPSGTPNLVKAWAISGELALLAGGTTYLCVLSLTRTSDTRVRKRKFFIRMLPSS